MNLDDILGTQEASEILGFSPDHVKLLCRQGKIPSKQIGKTWVMLKNDVLTYKEEIKMNTYLVNYQSFNDKDYAELVSAKNETDALKKAKKMATKHDDRDKIISIVERNDLNV